MVFLQIPIRLHHHFHCWWIALRRNRCRLDEIFALRRNRCRGLKRDGFNSTSISSIDFPFSYLENEESYHSVNFFLRKAFAELVTVRSSGWKRFVIFADTLVSLILFSFNFSKTGSVICPGNASIINKACCFSPRSSISRSFST